MEKYFLVENGTEVKAGEYIKCTTLCETPFGKTETTYQVPINAYNIPILVKENIIRVEKTEEYTVNEVLQGLADRLGWDLNRTISYIDKLIDISPIAAYSILLKTIAKKFDKKYEGHISNSEYIFSISTINGAINRVDKSKIKSYEHFAAFRTIEDAKAAKAILKFNELYGEQKD